MRIANPIYDVVFRYMMEDNKVARIVLSAILGKEVTQLDFRPTKKAAKLGEKGITVTRMDFNARVKQADGSEKLVIIELQKSKYFFQILRFRRYLGRQYANPENIVASNGGGGGKKKKALPILPIYILGEAFTQHKVPVIHVDRDYVDPATKEVLDERHDFIEALTHDAIVIQLPYLAHRRRTEAEQLLEIFDQKNIADSAGHILEISD
ncbi:MAG TPA: hypothetical protein ENJ95_13880, partial [Bacteroidetes bacterium]|nr:hypothetical protein [Bacteroidota bacterium]